MLATAPPSTAMRVLKITPERVASWDHAKLGGAY
jgi:hypothetical protein